MILLIKKENVGDYIGEEKEEFQVLEGFMWIWIIGVDKVSLEFGKDVGFVMQIWVLCIEFFMRQWGLRREVKGCKGRLGIDF